MRSFTCFRSLGPSSSRSFSTTISCPDRSNRSAAEYLQSRLPPYPYQPNQWYRQSNFGLYGGRRIQFGNTVSQKTEIKNRRAWRPNIRHQRLWSASLNRFVQVKVLARVLRTIDKVGGLDEYLLGNKARRIKELGLWGWKLRWRIIRTKAIVERFQITREQMGLRPLEVRRLEFHNGGMALGSDTGMVKVDGVGAERGKASDEVLEALEQQEEKAFDVYLDQSEKSGKALDMLPEEEEEIKQKKRIDKR